MSEALHCLHSWDPCETEEACLRKELAESRRYVSTLEDIISRSILIELEPKEKKV